MTLGSITLQDGRRLDTFVTGPEGGVPFVFHHGTPLSALPVRSFVDAVTARGLRFVSFSRPGYGDSGRLPGRRVADVVPDTEAVLAALGADRCYVAGWSGGGPHALACAARLPTATAALVIAGVGPYGTETLDFLAGMGQDNLDEFGHAFEGETSLRGYLDGARPGLVAATGEGIVAEMASLLPEVDRAALTGEFGDDLAASMREGLRVGVDGWLDDDLAFITDWGFDLAEVRVPTAIWQGSEDLMVPFAHGQWLAARVPGVRAHLEHGQGHVSITLGAVDRMLDELLSSFRTDSATPRPAPAEPGVSSERS